MEPVLIYLHGFLSSPASVKARQTMAYVQQSHPDLTIELPALSNYPQPTLGILEELAAKYAGRPLRYIGSSLGGYLSTYMVETFGGKAVLINPAVKPYELLNDYLGHHVNPYTNEAFVLERQHTRQLIEMECLQLQQAQNYWVLLQTDDETLDYRQAQQKYSGSKLTIEQGGDHSFQGYERFLPDIMTFLLDGCDCSVTS